MLLPEIETVRGWLADHVVGRPVWAVHAASARVLDDASREALEGGAISAVERVGRTLTLVFDTCALDISIRGAGELYVGRPNRDVPPLWRWAMEWEAYALWLTDRTGRSGVLRRAFDVPRLDDARQGVEPLSAAFTLQSFKKVLHKKRRTIFRLLVDGQQIAGIGETYADEILHASRVRPTRPAPTLDDDEIRAVYFATVEVLQKAIRFGGVSEGQHPPVEGLPGRFGRLLLVHGRGGEPCAACGGRVRRATIGDAHAFYCPRCQH